MTGSQPTPLPYGLLAEYETSAGVLNAAQRVRDAGFTHWDAFVPFPIPGLAQAMGLKESKVGWYAFLGGTLGCALGLGMVWYTNAYDYPVLIGGKPLFSPFPAIPVAFELTVLLAAFGALVGMLSLNRLPCLHHPTLKRRHLARATHDGFFLLIECTDPKYAGAATRALLEATETKRLTMIES